ncbi:MAG: hypothetical protein QXQ14_03605 [Candidatus Aenigmatarchaeota archaeon]
MKTCIICNDVINGTKINEKLIENLINYLKNKVDSKTLEKIKELKDFPICRWDLFQLVGNIIEDKSLANLFKKKLVKIYDFGFNVISV